MGSLDKVDGKDEIKGGPVLESKSMQQVIDETTADALTALEDPYHFEHPIRNVAVIGAGPSGLAAARALLEQGFKVQVFERNVKVGGIWVYSEPAESKLYIPSATEKEEEWLDKDKLAANDCKPPLNNTNSKYIEEWLQNYHHPATASYYDLTNNTATPYLGSFDFPWPEGTPYFVSHSVVQDYYQNYAAHFGLKEHIQLNTSLDSLVKKGKKWELTLTRATKENDGVSINQYQAEFDGVVIATGLFHAPFIPAMDGLQEYNALFPGKVIHSKQFKRIDDFENKNVLVIGGRVSAVDICRLVSSNAKRVHMAYRGPFKTGLFILDLIRSALPDSVIHKPGIEGFWSKKASGETVVDGTITFTDGSTLDDVDIVIFATGYRAKHSYFGSSRTLTLDSENGDRFTAKGKSNSPLIITDGKKVYNTYRDIFLISDPTLTFAGAPRHITTTPFFDYQGQAIARVWSRSAYLPSTSKMTSISLARTEVCPVYQMDFESENLRAQTILPWLNLHANKLVPDLRLPVLNGPPDGLKAIWEKAFDLYPKFVKGQYEDMALEYQQKKLRHLNV
ncbi:hypothetical protein BC941DRAFT_436902 [Chlamydoabsidia padenii]|nr:hypothetical protein BC941DRAFT_436902 [Chlamydoabsidia padenii]